MTEVLRKIFGDETFGPKVSLFGPIHIIMMVLIFGGAILVGYLLRNKQEKTKKLILDIMVIVLVGLYFSDFLVHPFMTGRDALIVDKLPYHLCTSACILIGLTRVFPKQFGFFKSSFVILGMIGGLMYLTVPTALDGNYLICYRSLQTIIYHGLIFWVGIFSIFFGDIEISIKKIWKEAIVIAVLDLISVGANFAYGGIQGEGETYNWFFSHDFYPVTSPVLMPFVMFGVLMVMVLAIEGIYYLVLFISKRIKEKKNPAPAEGE